MISNILFIAGIHGVGKTTLCKFLSSEFSLEYYSASDLIRKYAEIEFPKNKHIANIKDNQDTLITAIDEFIETDKPYILDGHFCLFNESGEITKIPQSTYEKMNLLAILCLYDDADVIYKRLKNRDRYNHNKETLNEIQKVELSYSEEIATLLDVPYCIGKSEEDRDKICKFIEEVL